MRALPLSVSVSVSVCLSVSLARSCSGPRTTTHRHTLHTPTPEKQTCAGMMQCGTFHSYIHAHSLKVCVEDEVVDVDRDSRRNKPKNGEQRVRNRAPASFSLCCRGDCTMMRAIQICNMQCMYGAIVRKRIVGVARCPLVVHCGLLYRSNAV